MNGKLISAICFKLFAIYFIVNVLVSIPGIWGIYFKINDLDKTATLPILVSVTTIVVAWFVTRKLWGLSNSVIQEFPDSETIEPNFEEVLYSVLGIFFIVSAIAQLPVSIISAWNMTYSPETAVSYYASYFMRPTVELIAGIFLTFKSSGIRNLLTKIRRAGV